MLKKVNNPKEKNEYEQATQKEIPWTNKLIKRS